MGKYDDAIGGGKIILDVEEVLNEESAKKVDGKIKAQKASLEKPIEINITTDDAIKKISQLTQALKQVKADLGDAISSNKSFNDIDKLVSKYKALKRQIDSAGREVDKNNSALKESNKIIKETKKIVDQLTVSQDKLNKTKKTKTNASTKKEIKATKELVSATEDVAKAQEKSAQTTLRTSKQVNAELDKELQKLKEIEAQQAKNDAARERFKKKQSNYGQEVLGIGHTVYDTDLLKGASEELDEFNELLNTRNKYQEKYNKLCRMIESRYTTNYGISQGMYKNLDEFVEFNRSMKELDALFESGQKTTNKHINELFRDVVRTLRSEINSVTRMLSSGDASSDMVGQRLDKEETELNKEMQELYEAREVQLKNINALRQEELHLIKQAGQEEVKNIEVQKKKALNMESVVKRYNKLMNSIGHEYRTIGTRFSEGTENFNLADMVNEAEYWLDAYKSEGPGSNDPYDIKQWRSEIGKLSRFVEAYKPFTEGMLPNGVADRLEEEIQQQENLTDVIEGTIEAEKKLSETATASTKIATVDEDELEIIQKENGALEEKLELLQEIAEQYANNITQRDRNRYEELNQKDMDGGLTSRQEERYWELGEAIDEADRQIEEFSQTYERVILKLGNGKKIEILPDDAGLKKFDKIANEYYQGEYNGVEIQDVIFDRVNATTTALLEEKNAIEQTVESKNKLKFSDGTFLSEKETAAVKKYCEILEKSMGEAYDEAVNLKAALDLVFDIKTSNIETLMDRFHTGNKASNAALQIMTGMSVNNQENRNLALRSTNPSVYDQIIAEQKAAAERAKSELANQKTDFQIKWEEFATTMLGGDAFKGESNLTKGRILKAFSEYADTAADAIDIINKAWLSGELEGKIGKNKYIQQYIDYLDNQREYYDSIRNAQAGDLDTDSLFTLDGTKKLSEEEAKALRDKAAAYDELIAKKKEYYGISETKQELQLFEQPSGQSSLFDSVAESAERAAKSAEELKQAVQDIQVDGTQLTFDDLAKSEEQVAEAAEHTIQLKKEQAQVIAEVVEQTQAQAEAESAVVEAEERKAAAADDASKAIDKAQRFLARDIDKALEQLRGALGDKKNLIDLSNIFSEEDLETQIGELVKKVNGSDLEFDSIRLFGDTASIQLSNKELGIRITQLYKLTEATEDATKATLQFVETSSVTVNKKEQENYISSQQKAIDSAEKWLLDRQKNLNAQKRSYQNSSKKIAGSTPLLNVDATTLEKDADKTIDDLVAHIQKRIQENVGKEISDGVKNQIIQDLNALENEIKIQQLNQYTSTTMSASEVEAARKTLVNTLDSLAIKARKNNVFDQISESYENLRKRLTDNTVEDYIENSFTSAINEVRVIKSELAKAIAAEDKNKQSQQNLQNLLDLQEKLYEAKKKYAELEAKGEVDTAAGQKASRKVEEIQQQYDASCNLLKNEEQIESVLEREVQLEQELNAVKAEQAAKQEEINSKKAAAQQEKINKAWKDEFQNNYKYTGGKTADDQTTLDSMSDFYKQQEEKAKQFNDNIKSIYDRLVATVKEINSLDTKMNSLTFQDKGTGFYAKSISSLQDRKSELVADLRSLTDEINNALSLDPSSEESGLSQFFEDARVQAALTSEEIQKFDNLLRESNEIEFNFGAKFTAQIQPIVEKITSLKKMIADGSIDKNSDITKNVLSIDSTLKGKLKNFTENPTAFNAMEIMKYVEAISTYIETLDKASQKEAKYFAGKQKYTSGQTAGSLDDYIKGQTKTITDAQKKLEDAAQNFVKDSNANGSDFGDILTKKFSQTADGISKLDFTVFDNGSKSLRTFSMEMGRVTEGIYKNETTITRSLANIQAAQKQFQSVDNLLSKLSASGVNVSDNSAPTQIQKLLDLQNKLSEAINEGDQSKIIELTSRLKMALSEVEKLYKQMVQMQDAIGSGKAKSRGTGDPTGNVYSQLVNKAKEFAAEQKNATLEIGNFDEKTNTLTVSLTKANGMVETFKFQMSALNGQMSYQQAGVSKLSTAWDQLKASMSRTGKQLMTALVGYNVFFKAISEVRKGINYVKEIDLAMTELKKVTDETEESYKQFLNTAGSTAGEIGSTVSDFTEATANFARLGYSMEESAEMAKTAIVYKNVADGLDTVEESTDSIISTMKAFGIESSDTMGIIDRFNEVKVICLLIW